MNAIERLRKEVVDDLFHLKTMKAAYPVWKPFIQRHINASKQLKSNDILSLGDSLYKIFRSTTDKTRSQAQVSSAGTAWEALVCLYLNLCLLKKRVVF